MFVGCLVFNRVSLLLRCGSMKIFGFTPSLCFFCFALLSYSIKCNAESERANLPPRGWNSYDSYSWIISEEQFLDNAKNLSLRLLSHGYEYAVVDYLWYRRKVEGAHADSLGFDVIDEWGRMVPDPDRWPSSRDGRGFTEVAKRVHSMGLKFGIHVMRGISTQAVKAETPILDVNTGKGYEENGKVYHANDIHIDGKRCAWMHNGFMSVDTNMRAGQAFLRSLYHQYAEWGVDFVKHDCVFGDDLDLGEIASVSDILKQLDREIWYSISPGVGASPAMAKNVNGLVNMYRITGDDWDSWGDVASHFDISRDLASANMIGAKGLLGNSWPDLDMLPIGWLTDPASNDGPHRYTNLRQHEQKAQMTLWAMARSPLMYGGDLKTLDEPTFDILTNPSILEINAYSTNNREFSDMSSQKVSMGHEHIRGSQPARSLRNLRTSINLTRCSDPKAIGWFTRVQKRAQKVCWKSENSTPFCLHKKHSSKSNVEEVHGLQDRHGLFLSNTNRHELCLDAPPKKRLRFEESTRVSLSPCVGRVNQMWDLNASGTLVNRYSGQCATLNHPTEVKNGSNGFRYWIATGRSGELYLASFNMNEDYATVSITISDVGRAIGASKTSCKCREVWTEKDFGEITTSVSMQVLGHGCALFVFNCN